MKSRSLVVMTILALVLAMTAIPIVQSAPKNIKPIEWLLEFEEETDINAVVIDDILWQRHNQVGDVSENGERIGTITMQVKLVVDMISLRGHANVKFIIELDGKGSIKGRMNGKIWYDEAIEGNQYVDGRFNAVGVYHVNGIVVNQDPPVEATVLLMGWKR